MEGVWTPKPPLATPLGLTGGQCVTNNLDVRLENSHVIDDRHLGRDPDIHTLFRKWDVQFVLKYR